jgi:predicted nucleic acid-binding protein
MASEDAPPSVFIDANVLFSGVRATGTPAEVLALHAAGLIKMTVSRQVVEELVRTLRRKETRALPVAMAFFDGAPPVLAQDPHENDVDRLSGRINQDDAPIVAAALAADVQYFVTGDRQLISELKSIGPPFAVLTPRELLDELNR